jgi:hypothetical protein
MRRILFLVLPLLLLLPGCGGDKAKAVNSDKDIPKHAEPGK